MTLLVSLAQAKAQVRATHDEDDDDIELKIHVASAAVLSYLKDAAYTFTDTSGELIDSSSEVPYVVQMAVLMLVGALYANRGDDGGKSAGFDSNYLPPAVVALLYPLRDPTIG